MFTKKIEEKKDTGVLMIRDIPVQLRKAFKILCAKKDTNMNQRMIELIERDVKRGDVQ